MQFASEPEYSQIRMQMQEQLQLLRQEITRIPATTKQHAGEITRNVPQSFD